MRQQDLVPTLRFHVILRVQPLADHRIHVRNLPILGLYTQRTVLSSQWVAFLDHIRQDPPTVTSMLSDSRLFLFRIGTVRVLAEVHPCMVEPPVVVVVMHRCTCMPIIFG